MTDEKQIEKLKNAPPIRKVDVIVISIVAIIVIILSVCLIFFQKDGDVVTITHNGNSQTLSLSDDAVVNINGVEVQIEDGKVRVTSSECNDKICKNTGVISKNGESIVCLPQGVAITIKKADGGYDATTGQER